MVKSFQYHNRKRFEKWFDSLSADAAAAVLNELRKLESGLKSLKPLGRGLFELRISQGPGYRLYGVLEGDDFVIIGFGTKDTQQRDVRGARRHVAASRS